MLAAQLSLAHAPGVAYTTFLCLTASLGILAAVLLRASASPAIAGSGLILQFYGGIAVIQGQFVWPAGRLWGNVSLCCSSPIPIQNPSQNPKACCSSCSGGIAGIQGQLVWPAGLLSCNVSTYSEP